jgi:hypothetical protein
VKPCWTERFINNSSGGLGIDGQQVLCQSELPDSGGLEREKVLFAAAGAPFLAIRS